MRDIQVPFLDLTRQEREIEGELRRAFSSFLRQGTYILGPEVGALEREFSAYVGCDEGVGVASGTDAIALALKALGAGEGDEVITPAFSAPPTAVAVRLSGAKPVFADIDPHTYNLDAAAVEQALTPRTRFLLVVHMYGRMADMPEILSVSRRHGLILLEDCAQAHGASLEGKRAGSRGEAGCYSFYPTKNLGAYGDAGMVVTNDRKVAEKVRQLRDYGRVDRDTLGELGVNGRLDEVQAALLRVKLRWLEKWNERRRDLARLYLEGLSDLPLRLPCWEGGEEHCFHLFVVGCEQRDRLRSFLAGKGIGTAVHYSLPLHLQRPFLTAHGPPASCPVAEEAAARVLSLPLYPHIRDEEVLRVIEEVRNFYRKELHIK